MSTRASLPIIYGTGFVALDIVVDRNSGSETLMTGGTCGNVLTIMAFLGWQSTPIARLEEDTAGTIVREDLAQWGVNLDQIGLEPKSATPIVIEEIYKNRAGIAKHRYIWTCPDCGGYLPQYRPVLAKATGDVLTEPVPQVFFFDRVSRAAIDFAKRFAAQGTAVVFEPSGSADPRLFREAVRTCHILKYSSQRVRAFADLLKSNRALIEIETLGDEGLRYRTNPPLGDGHNWRNLPPFHVEQLKDSAGSGDWCTAGLLFKVASQGRLQLSSIRSESLEEALQFGQALSAWNCRFPSARVGMYVMSRTAVLRVAQRIVAGSVSKLRAVSTSGPHAQAALFCPSCARPGIRLHALTRPRLHKVV